MAQTATQIALAQMLDTGSDWSVKKTSVSGVYVQKMPGNKSRGESLCVIVNPPNGKGNPSKRKHLYIRTAADVAFYKAAFNDPKMMAALAVVSETNGEDAEAEIAEDEELLDI